MLALGDLLSKRTWYALWAVSHMHVLPFDGRHTKAKVAGRLLDQLRLQGHLKRSVKRLSADERAPLIALQAAGGQMPKVEFMAAFGAIRLYRPWRPDVPRQIWKQPGSIAEKLWYLALIEIVEDQVCIPTEVLALLPPLPRVRTAPVKTITEQPPPSSALLVDLAHLLGVLMAEHATVRWNRWLPPHTLKAVNQRLLLKDQRAEGSILRSELHTTRLRFLHYLLECCGLVAVQAGYLKPTLAAWQWLDSTPEAQWQTLMESIERDLKRREPLWNIYRLPAVTLTLWQKLVDQLRRLHPNRGYRLSSLIRALRPHLPGQSLKGVPDLLCEPLTWLGIVTACAGNEFQIAGSTFTPVAPAALINEADCLRVVLPIFPRLRSLVELSAWATYEQGDLCIDQQAVARALDANQTTIQIATLLHQLTGEPLPDSVFARLQGWEKRQRRLALEPLMVLSSPQPELLAELLADRSLRPLFDGTLSAHHVAVKPHQAEVLSRRLRRRGHSMTDRRQKAAPPTKLSDPDLAAQLWLAARIYQALSGLIALPATLPGSVLESLKAHIPETGFNQLAQSAENAIDAIRRAATDGWSGLLTPIQQENADSIRAAIEQAYAKQSAIMIDYFSPAQGVTSRRTIEPLLPIVDRGDFAYVEAWCQEAEAERTFRLDRILRIVTEVAQMA
ncbi:MAG: WYL domain-containing protein [Chloroflexota bacterium]